MQFFAYLLRKGTNNEFVWGQKNLSSLTFILCILFQIVYLFQLLKLLLCIHCFVLLLFLPKTILYLCYLHCNFLLYKTSQIYASNPFVLFLALRLLFLSLEKYLYFLQLYILDFGWLCSIAFFNMFVNASCCHL